MCTSFAVYKNKPIYSMNFDCWNVDSRIRICDHDGLSTFYFEVNLGGYFLETASMNTYGFFGNCQGNLSDKHQNIIHNVNCMPIGELYRQSLQSARSIEELYSILDSKKVIYPPVPPEYNKLHNMFADKNGNAIILETATGENDITTISGDFLIMTNFPAGQFKGVNYKNIYGAGSDRYITSYEYLMQHTEFKLNNALELLENTIQKEDDWETLVSMVFIPDELSVYIVVKRNFSKIWRVDINRKVIESFHGFEKFISMELADTGMCLMNLDDQGTLR